MEARPSHQWAVVSLAAVMVLAGLVVGWPDGAGGDPALPAVVAGAPCVRHRRLGEGSISRLTSRWFDGVASVDVTEPLVAIGIDDGPDPEWTPVALEVLERHGARATFFVVGEAALRHPDLVRAIRDAGHEVALHSMGHDSHEGRDELWLADDLTSTVQAVRATGVEPSPLLRHPRGVQDIVAAETACRAGVRGVGWTAWVTHLARGQAPPPQAGDVLLAHDGRLPRGRELSDLDTVLTALHESGLDCVPVGELLRLSGLEVPAARP